MREIVLINITGEDRPGLTAAITGVLAQGGVNILDIGQAVIHDTLSFGILVEIPDTEAGSSVLKDVLFTAYKLDQQVRFTPVSEEDYRQWVDGQGKARHIVTLLTRRVTAEQLQRVSSITAKYALNIDHIDRLSGRMPLDMPADQGKGCIEFSVRGEPADPAALRAEFLSVAQELNVDIAFQQDSVFRRNRRLAVFDMDSTLIEAEVIDELAKAAGVGEKVAAITERAMRGELDFRASFKERLALLQGLSEDVLEEIGASLRLTEGAETLFAELKRLGYKTAILSGGFTLFRPSIAGEAGDRLRVRQRVADRRRQGHRGGGRADRRCPAQGRPAARTGGEGRPEPGADHCRRRRRQRPADARLAGLGVAFRAKPLVKQSAKQAISTLGLDGILYLLGYRDREGRA
ncbi:putative phosphoserine phosphatase [Pseudomonas aeruginosa]|nr:putative phosphoserine phosphatase [Pseudomonas aeruginosa]